MDGVNYFTPQEDWLIKDIGKTVDLKDMVNYLMKTHVIPNYLTIKISH
jgi:hypothetical protein